MRVLVGLVSFIALAASHGQNFPVNDVNRWAYDTLDDLRQCRLLTASLPVTRGGPMQTRYEFGVATYANVTALSERLDEKFAAFASGKRDVASLPKDRLFDQLDRMISHFRKEIASLGTDPEGLSNKVAAGRKRAAELRLLYMSEVSPRARKNFPDIPENHWAYDVLEELYKFDLLPKKFVHYGRQHASVYSFAKWSEIIEETIERLPVSASLAPMPPDDDALFGLARLCRFFEPELRSSGVSVTGLQQAIDKVIRSAEARRRPLADVHGSHWASQAITNLHSAGVLSGYPSGKFGG